MTVPALKEWASTVRALIDGDQLVTLRKGGIHETDRHFELEHERFMLYPTFDHQRVDLIREPFHHLLSESLADATWKGGLPERVALEQDGQVGQPDTVRIGAWAKVTEAIDLTDGALLGELAGLHIWTSDYAEKRLHWKRTHPLHALLLRVHRLPDVLEIPVEASYGGCRSWVDIDTDIRLVGEPVLSEAEFEGVRQSVRRLIPA